MESWHFVGHDSRYLTDLMDFSFQMYIFGLLVKFSAGER